MNIIATEEHGRTRKYKYLTGNFSVFFRVLPWLINKESGTQLKLRFAPIVIDLQEYRFGIQ
jgi:hypothetical protein